jgi:catechol 2,3-dioxygenase-like lactoylglutathione lyase family enzyme
MSTNEVRSNDARLATLDMKLEVIVIPVADADRAKEFYSRLGWRLDADVTGGDFRLIQFTPPGSGCSIQFGRNLTSAAPGSSQDLYLVVSDLAAARARLTTAGIEVGEVFHCETGANCRFHGADPGSRVSGPAPGNATYGSFATFADPDGNGWLFQQVTTRLPGRIDPAATSFGSASELAGALRRAEAAHGEHEKRIGHADPDWPDWYAAYMVAELAGEKLPS